MKQFNNLTIKKFILYWLPTILWMLMIFYFSSHPRFDITYKFVFDFIILKALRFDFIILKALHMVEYGILYFLFFRAFYKTTTFSLSQQFFFSFILSLFYAVTDEIHQLFIPTREGRIRDIIIDMAGIGLAYYYIKTKLQLIKKML